MGLDVGSRTVGVAVSDLLGWTAQGVEIIRINEDEKEFGIDRMKELVAQFEPTGFVLGLPKNMNNTYGEATLRTKEFSRKLENKFNIEVVMQDERLSSVAANNVLLLADLSRRKRKSKVDTVAATIILQSYLDIRKGQKHG